LIRQAIRLWIWISLLVACSSEVSPPLGPKLAQVGSNALYLEQAKSQIPNELFRADSAKVLRSFVDQWIRTQLVSQEATRQNLGQLAPYSWELEQARYETLAFIMRRKQLEEIDAQAPIEDEIINFYNENKAQFTSEEKKVRVLLLRTSELNSALEAKKLLAGNANWQEIVQEVGLQKEVTIHQANEFVLFSDALIDEPIMRQYLLEGMNNGEISAIRRVEDEYHFIQILDLIEAGQASPLSEVRDVITTFLKAENRRKKLRSFERQLMLRAEANNEVSSIFDN